MCNFTTLSALLTQPRAVILPCPLRSQKQKQLYESASLCLQSISLTCIRPVQLPRPLQQLLHPRPQRRLYVSKNFSQSHICLSILDRHNYRDYYNYWCIYYNRDYCMFLGVNSTAEKMLTRIRHAQPQKQLLLQQQRLQLLHRQLLLQKATQKLKLLL
jgi:hypothetical protein